MGRRIWGTLGNYGIIALGCFLYALSFNWFFRANGFVMGGFTGLGQIANRLLPGLPVGTVVFALNLPLLIISFRRHGTGALLTTLFAITVSAVCIDALGAQLRFSAMGVLPALMGGGASMGFSLGLLLRKGATTGGTELLAKLLQNRFTGLSLGRLCLYIDVSIIGLYTLIFREPENAIYGAAAMFVATKVLDYVVYRL